jgi:hypothetical protein
MSRRKNDTERKLVKSIKVVEGPLRDLATYLEGLTPDGRREFEATVTRGVRVIARERDRRVRDLMLLALAVRKQGKR